MSTRDGSAKGVVADEPQGSNTGIGRPSFQEPNRTDRHLAAKNEDWANRMIGEAPYRHTLMIMRKRGNDSNLGKINSRRWAQSECGIQIGENGEGWATISIIQRDIYLQAAFARNVPARPFGIYEILMVRNRDMNQRKKLEIGETGNSGVLAISVMVETIEGTVGGLSTAESTAALAERGAMTEMPSPDYGYVRSSATLHERIDNILYNGRGDGNLAELTYADRLGRDRSAGSCICQKTPDQRCACRYRVRDTRGAEVKGDMRGRLAELQISTPIS